MNGNSNQSGEEKKPWRWWQWFLVYPSFAIALLGAIPQYANVIKGLIIGVSASKVPDAVLQNRLWEKNAACDPLLREVTTRQGIVVAVGACQSGDIQVNLQYPDGTKRIRWIPFEGLEPPPIASSLPGISTAAAQEPPASTSSPSDPGEMRVICQQRIGKAKLLRKIQSGAGCFEEIINTYTGVIEETRPIPCDTPCAE